MQTGFRTFSNTGLLVVMALLSGCAFGNPMGGGNPEAASRAVTTASTATGQCAAPLGSAEVISAEMAGMPAGMAAYMPGGDITGTAAAVARKTGCFSVIANDAGTTRARAYNGRSTHPDYVISVSRQMIMPTYGDMMGKTALNLVTFGGYAMSGGGGASTQVTVTITNVRTEIARTGTSTDSDAGVAAAAAMAQAMRGVVVTGSPGKQVVSRN